MKKIFSVLLVLTMVLPMLCFSASAETVTADITWYDESKTEFKISTAAQLLGLSQLGQSKNFAGKTVKLDADITLNEGDSSKWGETAPAISWAPIKEFAGTLDGQGHTISGIYSKVGGTGGFIMKLAPDAVLTNFKMENSYIEASGAVASIASSGSGTISYVYSNATVVCGDHHAGGIFGVATTGTVNVSYCWFDGSLTLKMRYGAGIVGNGNGNTTNVSHCLNTGSIYSSCETTQTTHIGGIVGRNDKTTNIVDCLNLGSVSTYCTVNGINDVNGALMGACSLNTDQSALNVKDCWASTESYPTLIGANAAQKNSTQENMGLISEKFLTGYSAYYNTTLDFESTWTVVADSTPMLQCFADEIVPVYDVNAPAISDFEIKSEGYYGPRWTLTLELKEGIKPENVTVGALICPTKAIPENHDLNLLDTSFTYRDKEYAVANVEGKILRESEEGTIVATFVITDIGIDLARTDFTVRPYAIYDMDGVSLEVYGNSETATFYTHAELLARDEKTDAETKKQLETVLAPINKVLGDDYPLSHDWSTMDLFEKIPAMIADGTSILKTRDHGAGNYVVTIDMTMDEDYKAYLALLEKYGFEKVYDNGETGINDSVYTSTYKLDDLYVTVTHISYDFQTFISACFDVELSEHLEDKFSADVIEGKSTKVHMLQIHNPGGNSIVIELKNGHFIVSDGGTEGEFEYLMRYLFSLVPEGEKPIIDAWIVTHLHNDHFHVMNGFNKNPQYAEKLYVEGFYIHEPSDEVKDMDAGVYGEIANEYKAISLMKTTKGETPKIYRPQTGQRYYFSDIYFEILMAPEQVWPEEHTNSFNDSSVFYFFNIEGQTFLNGGDGSKSNMEFLMTAYDAKYLHFDLFQVLHHGHNTWDEFTDYCSFGTLLFCSPAIDKFFVGMSGANGHLIDVADDYYVSNYNSTVFKFPYKLGSAKYVPMP